MNEEEYEVIKWEDGEVRSDGHVSFPPGTPVERTGSMGVPVRAMLWSSLCYHRAVYMVRVYHLIFLGEVAECKQAYEKLQSETEGASNHLRSLKEAELEKKKGEACGYED